MNICENCGKEHDGSYGTGRFCSNHCRHQWIGKKVIKHGGGKPKKPYGFWKCPICGEILETGTKLSEHKRELHKDVIPGPHNKGGIAWNKGLTKKTSEIIKQAAKKLSSKYSSGELKPSFAGRKHSDETKRKMSEAHKTICYGKSIWSTQIEHRRSYAEQYFLKVFTDAQFNYHVNRYFLDFAWPDKKTYIEVDGEQHYKDPKVIEHDKIRTEKLLELGWRCLMRIRWSKFKKLSDCEKHQFLQNCFTLINN